MAVALVYRNCGKRHATIPSENEAVEQVRKINSANSSVKSISCKASAPGADIEILYAKPSMFIATTSYFGRKQAEVASDGVLYWFWIREFDRNSVYHCPLSRISSTRVTFPMRPKLIVSVLCVDELIYDSMSVDEEGTIRLWSKEEDLSKCVSIREGNISEIDYYFEKSPILNVKIMSHQRIDGVDLPKNVRIFWHDQKASTSAELKDIVLNGANPHSIKMPENLNKISLIDF